MARESEVGLAIGSQVPYFDCLIHGSGCEFGEILGIEDQAQYEMFVLVKRPLEGEPSLIIPNLDLRIIRTGDYERLRRVHDNTSNEIVMRFEGLHLLHRIVVEYPHLKIVTACQHPVLAAQKLDSPDGESGCFDCANAGLDLDAYTLFE